ncbi:hypothetical protein E2C01_051423 [Portunus trituberculatus]|uniref:Uncharacterized protein n=1 Tax=Portunus trituberculatus TaxID=210409 RepID=A0A5B7GJ24_PORTR|nr:hypothetical protein [Portunus trituberculatus]
MLVLFDTSETRQAFAQRRSPLSSTVMTILTWHKASSSPETRSGSGWCRYSSSSSSHPFFDAHGSVPVAEI